MQNLYLSNKFCTKIKQTTVIFKINLKNYKAIEFATRLYDLCSVFTVTSFLSFLTILFPTSFFPLSFFCHIN
jgi:hypothetical protein